VNRATASDLRIRSLEKKPSSAEASVDAGVSTVLIATVDPEIRKSLAAFLEAYPVKTLWAKSVEEVRSALARTKVSACFCGFWLLEGTYRDVIRYLRSQPTEIPAIIACAPACPDEYQDYLAALNIRAFDFISFPYSALHVERVLRSALWTHQISERKHSSMPTDRNTSDRLPDYPWDQGRMRKAG
jgi:DNA-binding NtrC family response regulator